MSSSEAVSRVVPPDVRQLRHPLEQRVASLVSVIDAALMTAIVGLLFLGAELLEKWPYVANYKGHAKFLLALVLGAPVFATFLRRRRRLLAQQESIRISERLLPAVHAVLVKHCQRAGIPTPELYVSDSVEHTTSFSWRHHHCIILSTHDFATFQDAFTDVVDFLLAREVGSICLGYTSYRNELLASSVAPIPFLRAPLNHMRTLSRDRYAAFLAPRSIRALIVEASGDRVRRRMDLESYFAQLDEGKDSSGILSSVLWLLKEHVPLAHRVQELRRAGLLRTDDRQEHVRADERRRA